jgi:hypothetical protein
MEALVSNGIHFSLRGVQFLCTKIGAKKKKKKEKSAAYSKNNRQVPSTG